MRNTKTLLAAASLAVLTAAGIGSVSAAPWDHQPGPAMRHDIRQDVRHDVRVDLHRRIVDRDRVWVTLRDHHLRGLGDPYFLRGHYVVRVADRFGHPIVVEINPYTGAFLGEFRA
jgi:hypothetical protein